MDTARGHREHARHPAPVLVEEDPARAVFLDVAVAHQVDPSQRRLAVAFQLADDGARMQVVAAQQAQELGQDAEVDAVIGVAVHHRVHRAVDVEKKAVVAAPLGQRIVRGPAQSQVVRHDDRRPQLLGELGALVHLLDGGRGHVHVVALALAGLGLGLVDGLLAEQETVAPAHEGLRVDVLVVLGEIEPAPQAFIDRPP